MRDPPLSKTPTPITFSSIYTIYDPPKSHYTTAIISNQSRETPLMKATTFLIACLLLAAIAQAADASADKLMPYNAAGKWGFIACDAAKVEFAIPPTYDLAHPFRDGRAAVRKDKLFGFIDDKGAVVIDFQFDDVQRGIFRAGVAIVKKRQLYGAIDRNGKEILPINFKSITVDETEGRLVAAIDDPADPNNFSGLSGLYDTTGKPLLPHEYKYIYAFFKNGVTAVQKGDKYALANSAGQLLTPLQYDQILHSDITHFIAVKDKGQTHDVYDEKGKLLFSAPYTYVGALVNNRAVFKDPATKLNGYLDSTGKIVLPAQFVLAGTFSEGLAVVQRKTLGPIEVIDDTGKSIGSVPNAFIRLDKFKKGLLWLADRTDKKIYLYNKQLEKVVPQGFYYAADFDDNGLSRAQSAPRLNGLINQKGEWVLQPEYSQIELSSIPGQYIVTKDKERAIVNAAGQILFKPQAVGIEKWDQQFVKISPPGFSMTSDYHCFWRHDGVFFYNAK